MFNYEEKGKRVLLIKPATDNRDDRVDEHGNVCTIVRSRIGLYAEAVAVSPEDDVRKLYLTRHEESPLDVLICDECR